MQDIARKDNTITLKSQISMKPMQIFYQLWYRVSCIVFNTNEKLNI
jgi:hypothetical protein